MLTQDSIIIKFYSELVWYSKTISMKKVITLTLLLAFVTVSFCQDTNNDAKKSSIKKIYLQVGTGGGSSNSISLDFGIQAVLKNNLTASISYKIVEMNPKNLPDDYEPGVTYFIFPFPDELPHNDLSIYSLTLGKYFKTGRKTWFTMEGGLSLVTGQKMEFTSQPVVSDYFYESSNYSVKSEDKTGFGAMLKTDFNWAVLPYVGLGAGVFANLNSLQSPVGFEIKLLCGWLNTKRKH